jgi:uncharacterized protein YecE (DUF72 family)
MRLRAGTSGFSYAEWRGRFYPVDLPDAKMLGFYAERLPAVEINNTFYRMPKAELLAGWRDAVAPDFQFVLKASRRITHLSRLVNAGDSVAYLFGAARSLGDKLGPILFQLPPFLKKDVAVLRDFLAALPQGSRAAFEFRNPSWFEDDVYETLREKNAALCLGDAEDEGRSPPIVATADFGYLRLRNPSYDDVRLGEWLDTIRAQPCRPRPDARAYATLEKEPGPAVKPARRRGSKTSGKKAG